MKKTFVITFFLGVLSLAPVWAFAQGNYIIESRFFRGARNDTPSRLGAPVFITSFSDPLFIPSRPPLLTAGDEPNPASAMKLELANIYKLKTVDDVSSGQILWDGKKTRLSEAILLDGNLYPIHLFPRTLDDRTISLRIEVRRDTGRDEGEKILNSEITLSFDDPVVLGFPVNGHSYFLSLEVKKTSLAEVGQVAIEPREGELNWRQARAILPQPTFTVTPVYPEKCKEENIQGWVALYVYTNVQGKVLRVRVLGSSHPALAKSAVEAIRQWRYQPVMWKGKPIYSEFYMTVDFRLRDLSPSAEGTEEDAGKK